MPYDKNLLDVLTAQHTFGGLDMNTLRGLLSTPGLTNGPAPFQGDTSNFAARGPAPKGDQPGFDFVAPLPVQRLLQQLPQNPVINALLALNPTLGLTASAPNSTLILD